MSTLRLENVSVVYSEGTPYEKKALDNISFTIESGKITGLIGHTGSGKSTLVKTLNGLERPTSGKVYLDGNDIWAKPKKIGSIRFRIGLVMQYPEYQLFEETVYRDIAFGPKNMKLSEEEIDSRVRKYAEIVGLEDSDLDKSPFDLSGGQKRRVAIAGIMAMTPEIIILDEPAAGLDPEGKDMIFDAIQKYREDTGATVIIVSHSMEDMAERCDNVAILRNGKLEAFGSKRSIFSDPARLTDAGLDIPEITSAALLLKEKGIDLGPVYTVKEAAFRLVKLLNEKGDF